MASPAPWHRPYALPHSSLMTFGRFASTGLTTMRKSLRHCLAPLPNVPLRSLESFNLRGSGSRRRRSPSSLGKIRRSVSSLCKIRPRPLSKGASEKWRHLVALPSVSDCAASKRPRRGAEARGMETDGQQGNPQWPPSAKRRLGSRLLLHFDFFFSFIFRYIYPGLGLGGLGHQVSSLSDDGSCLLAPVSQTIVCSKCALFIGWRMFEKWRK